MNPKLLDVVGILESLLERTITDIETGIKENLPAILIVLFTMPIIISAIVLTAQAIVKKHMDYNINNEYDEDDTEE